MLTYSIYSIRCLINNKIYFGRSQEIEKRWRAHRNLLRKSKHQNTLLQQDWNDYGEHSFAFEVITVVEDLTEAINLEQEYIDSDKYSKYNISDAQMGGDTFTNNPRKELTRAIKKFQNGGIRNPMYGKSKSEKMLQRVKEVNSKPIYIEGFYYKSIAEASKILNVNSTTIQYRLKATSSRFKDWIYA